MVAKNKYEPSCIEITGIVKYANKTVGNIHSTELVVDTVYRLILR